MSKSEITYAYRFRNSPDYPHVKWIELNNDGVLHECAVLKEDSIGNLFYFQINHLDEIDKRRLAGILMDRNARTMELWDIMVNKTLGNGVNALQYFHQLAKVLTPSGKILDPKSGQMGLVQTGTITLDPPKAP